MDSTTNKLRFSAIVVFVIATVLGCGPADVDTKDSAVERLNALLTDNRKLFDAFEHECTGRQPR